MMVLRSDYVCQSCEADSSSTMTMPTFVPCVSGGGPTLLTLESVRWQMLYRPDDVCCYAEELHSAQLCPSFVHERRANVSSGWDERSDAPTGVLHPHACYHYCYHYSVRVP